MCENMADDKAWIWLVGGFAAAMAALGAGAAAGRDRLAQQQRPPAPQQPQQPAQNAGMGQVSPRPQARPQARPMPVGMAPHTPQEAPQRTVAQQQSHVNNVLIINTVYPNGTPVEGATVIIPALGARASSDNEGLVYIPMQVAGQFAVELYMPGSAPPVPPPGRAGDAVGSHGIQYTIQYKGGLHKIVLSVDIQGSGEFGAP